MSTFSDQLTQRITFLAAQRAAKVRSDLEARLKQAAPVSRGDPYAPTPGALRDSISVNVRYTAPVFTFTARVAVNYASFTNDGYSAFSYLVQRPRSPSGRPGAVRFFWGRSGQIEFRSTGHVINHPGYAGSQWFTKTLASFADLIAAAG